MPCPMIPGAMGGKGGTHNNVRFIIKKKKKTSTQTKRVKTQENDRQRQMAELKER